MLIGPHAVVGGFVGESMGGNFLAFGVGFLSHFVLDAVPHFDTTDGGKWTKRQIALAAGDMVVWVGILIYFLPDVGRSWYFWGIFGAILPDLMDNVPLWNKKFRATKAGAIFHKLHAGIQTEIRNPILGIFIQYALAGVAVYFMIRFW